MARPRKQNDSRRKVYPLRLTEAERAALTAAAAGQGLTPADLLRAAFLSPSQPDQGPRRYDHLAPALDAPTVAALGRVGANLNQIARRIHSGDVIQPQELPEVLASIAQSLDRIEALVFASIEP